MGVIWEPLRERFSGVVVDSWQALYAVIDAALAGRDPLPTNAAPWPEVDPFADGCAVERIATYIKDAINGFETTIGSTTERKRAALDYADTQYAAHWGVQG